MAENTITINELEKARTGLATDLLLTTRGTAGHKMTFADFAKYVTETYQAAVAGQNQSIIDALNELHNAIGGPKVAATVAAMTDESAIYVYTGSETGYTAGNWYYYNGSAWTSGGVYNAVAVQTDPALSSAGVPADAKATGDAIAAATVAIDDTLTETGEAADAKKTGDEISGLKNALTQMGRVANIVGTDAVNVDLDIADPNGNVLARFANGHIQTKEFDSTDVNDDIADLKSGKIDVAQGVANAGKALVVGSDGNVLPEDITIELDDTLTQQGEAADAKAVGDAIDDVEDSIAEVNYNLGKFPEVKNTSDSDSDLFLTDSNGNALVQFADGHIKTKNFDSETVVSEQDIEDIEDSVSELGSAVGKSSVTRNTNAQDVDLDLVDPNGNVLARFEDGHIKTKNFDSSMSNQNAVKTVNNTAPDANGNVNVRAELDPEEVETAVSDYLDEHPVVASAAGIVSVAEYGAIGDGTTDDSAAIQNAVNSNYDVYFESDKTYYIASTVTINHDIKLHGGKNTVIKTKTPNNAAPYDGIRISGTLKTTTTLTSNYVAEGSGDSDNISNRFTLVDMSNVEIGDILVITATDQYYSYSRRYYYLGGVLKVNEIYDGHIYTNRNMPWDITLTNSVTVLVYSAPTAIIENLTFVGDLNAFGSEYSSSYASLLRLSACKDSVIRNCNLNHMKVGATAAQCVNTLFENIELSKSRWINTSGLGDGYGIDIYSCTQTIFDRVNAICAEDCIDMDGTIPNIDTYVYRCDLGTECRSSGFSMHDNAYNTVLEDCVLMGASLYGNCVVNRCQFVRNVRAEGYGGITFRGFNEAKWANLHVSDCTFPVAASCYIGFRPQQPQDYVQSSNGYIGNVLIENCTGGAIIYEVNNSEYILSNMIESLTLRNCKDMYEIYHRYDGIIKKLVIEDCTFINPYYLNRHTDAINIDNIYNTLIKRTLPVKHLLLSNVTDTYGERYILPEDIDISVSSDISGAKFIVCGENLASNDFTDYSAGSVSGSVGSTPVRTEDATATGFLSTNGSGNLVYAVSSGYSTNRDIFPKYMACVSEDQDLMFRISMIVKNTGQTSGTSFRLYIAVIDCETGELVYKNHSTVYGQATVEGLALSHSRIVKKGQAAFWYLYAYNVVSESETTIENLIASLTPYDTQAPAYKSFNAHTRTGDGIVKSVAGQNNILSSALNFNVNLSCDYANHLF